VAASDDYAAARRPVLERILIRSWEYRHLRLVAGLRLGAGVVLVGLALVTLSFGGNDLKAFGYAMAFLAAAAANLALGYWDLTIASRKLPGRVRELERSRARLVDDSAARLRRIERDLHDGAQAQMVAVAMKLGLAQEKLAGLSGQPGQPDLERILDLVTAAHRGAREAIAELRDLARGIHPPVLDEGLGPALSSLAARADVTVKLVVDLAERPSAATETIAYFCAAELLTNVAKHSGAGQATLEVAQEPGLLRLRVSDDGAGGARIKERGGLAGLAERVGTVDGTLQVASPPGGPTVISVELPSYA
jgi:signal transduction histidine kinase